MNINKALEAHGCNGMLFSPWTKLTSLCANQFRGNGMERTGVYVVALSESRPDDLVLGDKRVQYIGETHGPTQSLAIRLRAFALSCGLSTRGVFRHSGGERSRNSLTDAQISNLWVQWTYWTWEAASSEPPAFRGVLPQLAEKALLLEHARAGGSLPDQNRDGRRMPVGWTGKLSEGAIQAFPGAEHDSASVGAAKNWLLDVMANKYKIMDDQGEQIRWLDGGGTSWTGLLGRMRGHWIYLWAMNDGEYLVFESWRTGRDKASFGPRRIVTEEDAQSVAWEFDAWWNS